MNRKKIGIILIYIILAFVLFKGILIDFGAPSSIKYLLDVLNILLFTLAFVDIKDNVQQFKLFLIFYTVFFIIGTLSAVVHIKEWGFNYIYWILDIRLLFRFPMFLMSCSVLLGRENYEKICSGLIAYQLLNTLLIVYQFITVKVEDYWMRGDYLNGFFGVKRGGNLYVNVLLIAVILIIYNKWKTKRIKLSVALLTLASCFVDAVLIELKVFFVEFVLIVLILFVLQFKKIKFTHKNIIIGATAIIGSIIIMFVMVRVLYVIYPWMKGTMSLKGMISTVTSSSGYSGSGDFNRFTAITGVFKTCFNNNILDGLIGIGIGNCNMGMKINSFAELFSYTNYSWFQSSYIFAETGIVGLIIYICTFASVFFDRKSENEYSINAKVMAILALLLIIYDEVLKTEGAYIIYFILSMTFMLENKEMTENE